MAARTLHTVNLLQRDTRPGIHQVQPIHGAIILRRLIIGPRDSIRRRWDIPNLLPHQNAMGAQIKGRLPAAVEIMVPDRGALHDGGDVGLVDIDGDAGGGLERLQSPW